MMQKALLLISQATSSGLVISEIATVGIFETTTIVLLDNRWGLLSEADTDVLSLFDPQSKEYLYDTIKLGSYGPYLREQTTEIHQACNALDGTSVLCTITGVTPIES